jgi:CRP/FNR family transcriptional regulator, cyclic AMP receptor protein
MAVPVQILRRVPLLAEVEEAELGALAERFCDRVYDAGAPVVSRGSSGTGFFIIAEGEATVDQAAGKAARLRRHDFFGEVALIDGGRRSAGITAVTNMRCWGISRNEFRMFVKQHPEVAWRMLETLAARLRAADSNARTVGPTPPRRRWSLRRRPGVPA